MRGHVRKRGSTWAVVLDVGRDETGRRRQKWHSGFKTRKAAERELVRILQKIDSGGDPFPEAITVRTFAERWLEHQQGRLRPHTLRRYRQIMRDHIVPVIGDLLLTRVRPAHVQLVLDGIRTKGLAARSAVETRAVLSSAMRQAMEWGLTTTNPVQAVRPPKQDRPQLVIPTPSQLTALVKEAKGTPWEAPIVLAANTGARRAEVLALRWADLDLDTGRLRITRSLQRVSGTDGTELVFLDPKTDRARRQITLTGRAVEHLRRYRNDQTARRLAFGPGWHELDLICDRGDGAPFDPDAFTRAFRRLATRSGLPAGMRLHDVRHGVATALLGQGVHPAIASAVLGHASPAFTMSVYQHVLDGMTDQAALALEKAFATGSTVA